MTLLDIAQKWMVEIAGTIIFLLSAVNFILLLIGQQAYAGITISFLGLIVGLLFMGYKKLPEALTRLKN